MFISCPHLSASSPEAFTVIKLNQACSKQPDNQGAAHSNRYNNTAAGRIKEKNWRINGKRK